jgi:hypothetical protein
VFGAKEQGFDPKETRYFRKSKKDIGGCWKLEYQFENVLPTGQSSLRKCELICMERKIR